MISVLMIIRPKHPHNPKVAGSNPAPATNLKGPEVNDLRAFDFGACSEAESC